MIADFLTDDEPLAQELKSAPSVKQARAGPETGERQQGPEGDYSFYYSLPRLRIWGSVTYTDETGQLTTVEVSGLGWVDRQWGDFMTNAWDLHRGPE